MNKNTFNKLNKILISSGITVCVVLLLPIIVYWFRFYEILTFKISKDFSDWINFSSYFNNFVAPLLSFASVIILIYSLLLQISINRESVINQSKKDSTNHLFALLEMKEKIITNIALKEVDNQYQFIHPYRNITGQAAIKVALATYNSF